RLPPPDEEQRTLAGDIQRLRHSFRDEPRRFWILVAVAALLVLAVVLGVTLSGGGSKPRAAPTTSLVPTTTAQTPTQPAPPPVRPQATLSLPAGVKVLKSGDTGASVRAIQRA